MLITFYLIVSIVLKAHYFTLQNYYKYYTKM